MRILRVVGSRDLPCGCCVGLYELYNGTTVQVVDGRGDRCHAPAHQVGALLAVPTGVPRIHGGPESSAPLTPGGDAGRTSHAA